MTQEKTSHWIQIIGIILILGISIYYCFENGLENGFTFDDHLAIDGNHDVTYDKYDSYLWFHDIWGKDLLEDDSHKSYRPLLILIFHYLWNFSNKPIVFRIFSVSFHFLATIGVFVLARSIFSDFIDRNILAFGTALLFATHPIHVESVTAVVNLAEPASALFIIASYLLFKDIYNQYSISRLSFFQVSIRLLLWGALVVVSILLKETGIITLLLSVSLVILLGFYQFLINAYSKQKFDTEMRKVKTTDTTPVIQSKFVKSSISLFNLFMKFSFIMIVLVLAIYFYFVFRELLSSPDRIKILTNFQEFMKFSLLFPFKYNGSKSYLNASGLIRRAENPYVFLKGNEKILSYLHLYYRYFALLVYPKEQSPEYSFDCIPKISDMEDPRNFYSVIWCGTILLIILIGIVTFFRNVTIHYRKVQAELSNLIHEILNPTINQVKFQYVSSYQASQQDGETPSTTSSEPTSNSEPQQGSSESLDSHILKTTDIMKAAPGFPWLESSLWLIIPFIPISGIIFTLGTLLAERLMYLTSIGYCLLFSLLSYTLISFFSSTIYQNSVSKGLHYLFYFAWIGVIVSYYIQQTRNYNLAWKSDDTLFFHALKVCPNSAKINLQTSKIYINHQDFPKAMKLVERAKTLDPEFCDAQFTEALIYLNLANEDTRISQQQEAEPINNSFHNPLQRLEFLEKYEEKITKAMNLCLENLKCIYTNKQSYKLLQDIWSHQLSSLDGKLSSLENFLMTQTQELQQQVKQQQLTPEQQTKLTNQRKYYQEELLQVYDDKISLLELQANLAQKSTLSFVAIQKFIENSLFCYEKNKMKKAFIYLKKAKESLLNVLQEYSLSNQPSSLSLIQSLPFPMTSSTGQWIMSSSSSEEDKSFLQKINEMKGQQQDQTANNEFLLSASGNTLLANLRFLQCRIAALNSTYRSTIYQYSKQLPQFQELMTTFPKTAFSAEMLYSSLQDSTANLCLHQYLHSFTIQQGNALLLEHIKVSNQHFMTLFHAAIFPFDITTIISEVKKKLLSLQQETKKKIQEKDKDANKEKEKEKEKEKKLSTAEMKALKETNEKERILFEFVRQLSIGLAIEFLSKNPTNQPTLTTDQQSLLLKEWSKIVFQMNSTLIALSTPIQSMNILTSKNSMAVTPTTSSTTNNQNSLQQMMIYQVITIWNTFGMKYYFIEKNYHLSSNYYGLLLSLAMAIHQKRMDIFLTSLMTFPSNLPLQTNTSSLSVFQPISSHDHLTIHGLLWERPEYQQLLASNPFLPATNKKFQSMTLKEYEEKTFIPQSFVFCQWIYYYLDSLVGIEGIYQHSLAMKTVTKILHFYGKCMKFHWEDENRRSLAFSPPDEETVVTDEKNQKKNKNKKTKKDNNNNKQQDQFYADNLLKDTQIIASLREKFRLIYCQITDFELQDAALCAYS